MTGATGGLGQALLPLLVGRGFEVSALYRSSHQEVPGVTWVQGDVTQPHLGLPDRHWPFSRLYHVAGLVSLTDRDRHQLLAVNTRGTYNVVEFCQKQRIPHLLYISTAYVDQMEQGKHPRNAYEMSKFWAEQYVREAAHDPGPPFNHRFRIPLRVTIFRPSILVPNPGLRVPPQGFLQYVLLMAQVHRRAELIRRKVEGALRLPPLEPLFRLRGDPQGTLNLVSTGEVARAIAEDDGGPQALAVRWLTHPCPPTFREVVRVLGEIMMLRIEFHREFSASPLESLFQRLTRPFQPYLWSAELPSDLPASEVDEGFIRRATLGLFAGAAPA